MDDPWHDVQEAGDWLLYLEDTVRPDVVHLNGYVHAALPFKAPVMITAHSCVVSWWQAVKKCSPPDSWNAYAHAVRKGIEAADMVVAPTRAMLNTIIANYGSPTRSQVVPNGRRLDVTGTSPKWPSSSVRDDSGTKPKTCVCSRKWPPVCPGRYGWPAKPCSRNRSRSAGAT